MIKNYLLVGLRNLMRHKFYTLLNILGLAIGIACALLSVLYVDYQYRFERHHEKLDRIYQVIRKVKDTGGTRYSMRTKAVAPVLAKTFPEIEHAVRMMTRFMWVYHEDRGFTVPLAVADKNIMDVFNIPLLQGDAKTGLDTPNSTFISQELAQKLFGDEDPIGKTVSVSYKWIKDDYTVTGILKDPPQTTNTILQFHFLTATFSDKSMSQTSWRTAVWERWPSTWFVSALTTYVLLKEGADPQALQDKLHPFAKDHQLENRQQDVDYYLQPLSRVHLHSIKDYGVAEASHGDITRCLTLLGIGLLVLTIACVNYINLITARSANRVREVGMRKVVGAARFQLTTQFLGESILVTLLACLFALLLAQAALPFFNLALESQLALTDLSLFAIILFPLLIVLIVGGLAGTYPALVLSAFSPVRALKGLSNSGSSGGWLRKGLVILQFCASVILIIGTLVVYQQTDFMRTKDLGFHREQVAVLSFFMADRDLWPKAETIKQELLAHSNVVSVTACHLLPGEINTVDIRQLKTEAGVEHKLYWAGIDNDYLKTLDMKLVAGDPLPAYENRYRPIAENQAELSILINETAAKMIGWENPVGQSFKRTGRTREGNEWTLFIKVVGVVRDYHNQSLHHGIAPQMYEHTQRHKHVVVRIGKGDLADTMAHLESVWKKFLPDRTFEYRFLDEIFDVYYKAEITLRKVYGFFAGLSIFVGCLGMLGLIAYTAQQRTKEIGVRKVLGAPESNLVMLLSRDFLVLAIIANLIAFPIAYWLSTTWLANFAYRIQLGPSLFVATGLLTLVIVFLTVGSQAWRAARQNPVDALRYE